MTTFNEWRSNVPREDILRGVYPNPRLAWLAFQLSSVLWKSSHTGKTIKLSDAKELEAFDSGFNRARRGFRCEAAGGDTN